MVNQTNATQMDAETRLSRLLGQLGKLSRVSQLVSEGHFFLYHPNADNPNPEDPINVLAENFNFMIKKLHDAHQTLENKVVERTTLLEEKTEQLEKLYQEVYAIKTQQDSDFYLTSLLLEPLGANRARSDAVTIEFLVDQKKKFNFRGTTRSIGGDLCGADSVSLQGETYTAFLNADAMGKSIQGAAGALIVGSIFDAIVKRANHVATSDQKSPERWLKEAFIELQKVFESFDSGMMISLMLGLICNRTATFYHVSAEYPAAVLLRNGVANFIHSTPFMRIGIRPDLISGPEYKPLSVDVLQLRHNDIIVSGSDGRDDLMMDRDGTLVMNTDDSQFLRIVQKHSGSLRDVYAGLLRTGSLSDDISLMRANISLPQGSPPPLTPLQRELVKKYRAAQGQPTAQRGLLSDLLATGLAHRWLSKRLALDACSAGDFEAALVHAGKYSAECPADSSMLFLTARLNARRGNIESAKQTVDRLLIRNPNSQAYQAFRARLDPVVQS